MTQEEMTAHVEWEQKHGPRKAQAWLSEKAKREGNPCFYVVETSTYFSGLSLEEAILLRDELSSMIASETNSKEGKI